MSASLVIRPLCYIVNLLCGRGLVATNSEQIQVIILRYLASATGKFGSCEFKSLARHNGMKSQIPGLKD